MSLYEDWEICGGCIFAIFYECGNCLDICIAGAKDERNDRNGSCPKRINQRDS